MFFLTTSGPLLASVIDDSNVTERIGFFVRNLQIYHQEEWRNLNVTLEYKSEGRVLNIQHVKNHVRQFLEDYPGSKDFWEIMNSKLVHSLVRAYCNISSLKSTLSLAPDHALSFHRESICKYDDDSEVLKESFRFTKLNYLICNESFRSIDLHVAFDLMHNPDPFDYPDYLWIDRAMEEFLAKNPINFSKWNSLKPKLEAFLLEGFPTLISIDIDITAVG